MLFILVFLTFCIADRRIGHQLHERDELNYVAMKELLINLLIITKTDILLIFFFKDTKKTSQSEKISLIIMSLLLSPLFAASSTIHVLNEGRWWLL